MTTFLPKSDQFPPKIIFHSHLEYQFPKNEFLSQNMLIFTFCCQNVASRMIGVWGNPSLTWVLSAYYHLGIKKFDKHQYLISCAFSADAVGISYQQQFVFWMLGFDAILT